MKKLRNKILFIIITILSISIITLLAIYNTQKYKEEQKRIESYLGINHKEKDKFIDATIYSVILGSDNEIIDVYNQSNNNIDLDSIKDIANDILNTDIKESYLGNLYISKYAYIYKENNYLTIMDLSKVNNNLLTSLRLSIFLFIFIEIIIILIAKLLTSWVCKPAIESLEKQKEFIADASHELKTPLSVIIASLDAYIDTQDNKWIDNIKTETDKMNILIKELLDLAKSENKENVEYKLSNLSKCILLATLPSEAIAYEKKIKIKCAIDEDIMMVMNEFSIKELMEILLDNAIKHATKNSIIKVSLKEYHKNIELLVVNKGEEIKAGDEEKIFERFYKGDKSRNRSSNRYGLGLAIAKNIVNNHHGSISAYSNKGYTTFKIIFKN